MASWTLTDLQRLDEAIAGGRLRVKFEDKDVTYRSLDELIRARTLVQQELGGATNSITRTRASFDSEL